MKRRYWFVKSDQCFGFRHELAVVRSLRNQNKWLIFVPHEPGRISDCSVFVNEKVEIGNCDGMKLGYSRVGKVEIRDPDLLYNIMVVDHNVFAICVIERWITPTHIQVQVDVEWLKKRNIIAQDVPSIIWLECSKQFQNHWMYVNLLTHCDKYATYWKYCHLSHFHPTQIGLYHFCVSKVAQTFQINAQVYVERQVATMWRYSFASRG